MSTGLRFEIVPSGDVEERLVRTFREPRSITLTVTSLPQHGWERTVGSAERLASLGFHVVPHLSARSIPDTATLAGILRRMTDAGISEIFAVSGDGHQTGGSFSTSLDMIREIAELGGGVAVGVAGYPEGHPQMSDEHLWQHLADRAPFIDKVITQLCFSAETIGAYAVELENRGLEAGLWIGVPGAIRRTRLVALSARLGVGSSLAFLTRSRTVVGGMLRSRDFDPRPFVRELEALPELRARLAGLHVYSFNEIERLPEFTPLV